MRPPPSAPPGPEGALMPDPGPRGVAAAAAAPLPTFLGDHRATILAGSVPSGRSLWSTPQDSFSAGPPRLYPPFPVSTDEKGAGNTGIRQRLCSAKELGGKAPLQMPVREVQQTALSSGCRWTLPPASCSLLLPTIFFYGYMKLAETHSTIPRGATRYDQTNGNYFPNLWPNMG